jgi:hypothetical protein
MRATNARNGDTSQAGRNAVEGLYEEDTPALDHRCCDKPADRQSDKRYEDDEPKPAPFGKTYREQRRSDAATMKFEQR